MSSSLRIHWATVVPSMLIVLSYLLLLQGCVSQPCGSEQGRPIAMCPRIKSHSQIRIVVAGGSESRVVGAGRDRTGQLHILAVANQGNAAGRFGFSILSGASLDELARMPGSAVTGWLDDELPWGVYWCEAGFFYTLDGRRINVDGSISDWIVPLEYGAWNDGDEILAATFSPAGDLALLHGPGIVQDLEGAVVSLEVFKTGSNKPSRIVKMEQAHYGAITVTTQRTRGRLVFNRGHLFAFLPGGTIWAGQLDGPIREVVTRKDFESEVRSGHLSLHGWTHAVAVGDGAFGVGRCGAWFVSSTSRSYIPVMSASSSELLAASCTLHQSNTVCLVEDLGSRSGVRLFMVNVDSLGYSSTLLEIRGNPSSLNYLTVPVLLSGDCKRKDAELVGEDGRVFAIFQP